VLVAAQRRRSGVWSAALGTVFEESSVDAAAFLAAAPAARRLLRACAAAGRALRRLHDEGARHRDLHAGNLLLRETPHGCEVLVVDLDRVRLGAPPDARGRMAEIARLYRSLVKRGSAGRVGARGCAAFLASYTGRDRNLRAALRAQLPRERRRLALHRLGYRLLPP
jgi:Ser/Thr protein kinase RdoA (MazF antagonist)